jgi:general stress protein 26
MNQEQENIRFVEDFIRQHKIGVLSTVDQQGVPQSAVVGISELEDLVLVFGTADTTRKYKNLKTNSHVSVVIGWDHGKTVQYEGLAEEISDPSEFETLKNNHLTKIPTAIKFFSDPSQKVFKIKPRWVRYTDLSKDPWEIIIIRF